ncbi:MAG: DUF4373 domain-containing protein [Candidatus Symbiothrix sp.]|jgi:hypothetical protein|nr:DUF4373 domain-containing protein [Candidatus Symbiothrix sp.]
MARPKKNNAEYFTHDADMRNDVRIKALRRKFKHTGYAIWCFLLEALTDSDYFELDWNEINIELLAADFDISSEELTEIVEYCIKIELMQIQDGKLYSKTHKNRLISVVEYREKQSENGKKGGNPNFKKGQSNPYYNSEKDNQNITDSNVNSEKDNPNISIVEESIVEESKGEKSIIYPYQDIVELWNSTCTNFPQVVKITDARKAKIKVRMGEFGKDLSGQMETVKKIFDKAQNSKFMRGDNKNGWQASFDWVFENSKNWVKIIEGNYDNKDKETTFSGTTSVQLGYDERIENGRRTYGTGKTTVPMDAPPRQSAAWWWNDGLKQWNM